MLTIYLDKQVLSQLRKPEQYLNSYRQQLSQAKKAAAKAVLESKISTLENFIEMFYRNKDHFICPYSSAHIRDISKRWDATEHSKNQTYEDLEFIKDITKCHCLNQIGNDYRDFTVMPTSYDPVEWFNSIKDEPKFDVSDLPMLINESDIPENLKTQFQDAMAALLPHGIPQETFDMFGIDEPELRQSKLSLASMMKLGQAFMKDIVQSDTYNKVREASSLAIIPPNSPTNSPLNDYKIKFSLHGVEREESIGIFLLENLRNTSVGEVTFFKQFSSIYSSLDFLAAYSEEFKVDGKNQVGNMYDDSWHSYCASNCDILVTEDKKLQAKSKAIYEFFGIRTKVMAMDVFTDFINSQGNGSLKSGWEFINSIIAKYDESDYVSTSEYPNGSIGIHYKLKSLVLNYFNVVSLMRSEVSSNIVLSKEFSAWNWFAQEEYFVKRLSEYFGNYEVSEHEDNSESGESNKKLYHWPLSKDVSIGLAYNDPIGCYQLILQTSLQAE